MSDLDSRQSLLIKSMRFPLIVLVVIAHAAGTSPDLIHWSLEGHNIYYFVTEMLSRHLCSIGVCWFYVFSGYFFFSNLKDGKLDKNWILGKWNRRIHTLLIPYLIWNSILVVLIIIFTKLYAILEIPQSSNIYAAVERGPLFWFFTGPVNYPLWFMRDLMILSLVAPALYYLFNKLPWTGLILIVAFYLSCILTLIPQFRAICFFSLGAWLGICRYNILAICRKVKIPAAILSVILLFLSTSQIGRPLHELLRRLFFPFGMMTFMNICDALLNHDRYKALTTKLSATVFFIFAAHEVFILGWTKGFLLRIFGDSLSGLWISYFLTPVIVLTVCLLLFLLFNRFTPGALAFICGGRTQKKAR